MQSILDRAEALMEEQPDSALALLRPYDGKPIRAEEQRARFALLYSMALDKNYIDTVNFDVLQPALDYYPTHGTDADKLRTLYYAGVIHENADSMASAMQAWADALQYQGPETDSLTLARLLVAQGNEYYRLYQFQKFVENQRKAEEIYRAIGKKDFADKAFLNQFELSLNRDSTFAKKNIGKVDRLATDSISPNAELARSKAIQYEMHFGSAQSLDARLKMYEGLPIDSLDLTQALLNLGRISEAERVLQSIQLDSNFQIKYLLRKLRIAKAKGNLEEALANSEKALAIFDRKQSSIIEGDTQFAEERSQWRHKVEKHMKAERNAWQISGTLLLIALFSAISLCFRLKNAKMQKELLEERAHRLETENRNRQLELERINSQLLEIEEEKDTLENIVNNNKRLETAISNALSERISALNSLFPLIANRAGTDKLAEVVNSLMTDRKKFLRDSRLAYAGTHPEFMAYLKEKRLTDDEIEYLCLYAIGFSGKEAGAFLGRKAYYNLSGNVRRKLGLLSESIHLSRFIRDLVKIPDQQG